MTATADSDVDDVLRDALLDVPGVEFVILFGSTARGAAHAMSDVDVAIQLERAHRPSAGELGSLVSRLESALGRRVDVVDLRSASPPLSYRIFRDGREVLVRDRAALVERKARAILDYLDFEPVERMCAEAVLAKGAR